MSKKAARLLLLAVLGLTACGAPLALGDNPPPNSNQVAYWCPDGGIKIEPVDDPFIVPSGNWTLLVIKGGSGPDENFVVENPVVGQAYSHPTAGNSHAILCYPPPTTTTSTTTSTTTTSSTTTTTQPGSTTTVTFPTPTPFSLNVFPACPPSGVPSISITFGNRPDLDGQTGTLSFSTGGSVLLVFQSNTTVLVPWPDGAGDIALLTYTLGNETETAGPMLFPEGCEATTTTTTTLPPTTTTTTTTTTLPPTTTTTQPGVTTTAPGVTTTAPGATTTTLPPGVTTTTLPPPFTFGAAATVCVAEVPTIRIVFQNTFPQLAGQTGTLTMADVNGNVVSTQSLVYQPNTTVNLLYPGTRVNADGTIADVPGWNLTNAGLWVRDPSDEFLRAGINLTYTVNPTATAFVTYPPESANCANPDGPFPPGTTPPDLPPTGGDPLEPGAIAVLILAAGTVLVLITRRRTGA